MKSGVGAHSLDGLQQRPAWISRLGALLGCLDYLGSDLSPSWVYGATGHAFVLNVHRTLCPSGPTAWKTERMDELAANAGCALRTVCANADSPDFGDTQRLTWRLVRDRIDQGIPCYGWELHIPEWYVITGYDDTGYFFAGAQAESSAQPLAWDRLGDMGTGWLEIHCVQQCEAADDATVLADAIDFALRQAEGQYAHSDDYVTGPAGFRAWADALEDGTAHRFGAGYNGMCWRECREHAARFLQQAKDRMRERAEVADLLYEAVDHYTAVDLALQAVVQRIPFRVPAQHEEDATVRDPDAAMFLREAATAEQSALQCLRRIAGML